jgi:peptidoglycan/LPS O-acetylase OafA/YrhL
VLHGGNVASTFGIYHPLANWQSFFFGMCLARLLPDLKVGEHLPKFAASAALAVLLCIFLFAPPPDSECFTFSLARGPLLLPLYALLLIFVPQGQDLLLRPEILESKPALWLGAMSGSLFILHAPIRHVIDWACGPDAVPQWLVFAVMFAVSAIYHELQQHILGSNRPATNFK